MAKKETAKTDKADTKEVEKKPAKKGGVGLIAFLIIIVGGLCLLPVTLIMLAGLIPSFAIAMSDRGRAKHFTVCVAALNCVGVVHMILELFKRNAVTTFSGIEYPMRLLSEPINWLIMWGGAGLGYALFAVIPPAIANLLSAMAQSKIETYKKNLTELQKTWGNDVKGEK